MKKEQLVSKIYTINKYNAITCLILVLTAYLIWGTADPDDIKKYIFQFYYSLVFILLMVQIIALNLKQKAVIRFLIDSQKHKNINA